MAQLIPTVPGIGGAFGTGFAGGVSKSLDALAQAKIKQMVDAPYQERLAEIFSYLSGAPEEQQGQQQSQEQVQTQQPIKNINLNQLSQTDAEEFASKLPLPQRQNFMRQYEDRQKFITSQQQPEEQKSTPQKSQQLLPSNKLTRQQFKQLLSTLPAHMQPQAVAAYQAQQEKGEKLAKEAHKEEVVNQREIDKRTQPFYDKVIEGEKSAKQVKQRLKRLKHLDEKGDLPPAALYNALTALESIGTKEGAAIGGAIGGALGTGTGALLGGPLGATLGLTEGSAYGAGIGAGIGAAIKPVTSLLRSALVGTYKDTEEYEKTSLEFIKDARPLIGGHVTENQLDLFLRSVPTLATSSHGRKRMINNIGIMAEGATAEYDAAEQIIRENGGKRPSDFEFKTLKLADKKRAEAAKRWED